MLNTVYQRYFPFWVDVICLLIVAVAVVVLYAAVPRRLPRLGRAGGEEEERH